jgi:hypothetical protein
MKKYVLIFTLFAWIRQLQSHCWLSKEAAEWIIEEFSKRERSRQRYSSPDRRSSSPFITGNGFRELCQRHCDESNKCQLDPSSVTDGDFIFIKADLYQEFATKVLPRINAKYTIISHNGDLSTPDGQSEYVDALGMQPYNTSEIIHQEFLRGKLLAHHGQNLWWHNVTGNERRPHHLHCLPIGLENRQYSIGKHPQVYVHALEKNIVQRQNYSIEEERLKPLLLVAFDEKSYAPDRKKVLQHLREISEAQKLNSTTFKPFYHKVHLSHLDWLSSINEYRLVLAPFGHGLDTHRISEILLMGGIPVMRRSSISSCYDDSDNNFNGKSQGSLPVVILESWKNLTEERLEQEWNRIVSYPKDHWDWKRLTLDHWIERIGLKK